MSRLLVLCPNGWDHDAFSRPEVHRGHEVLFAGEELISGVALWRVLTFDVRRWIEEAIRRYRGVDGVVGTGDYPGCMLAAEVAEGLGLRSAGAGAVVRLSHKFYSREIQRSAVPAATPEFEPVDPLSRVEPRRLTYPYFLKPVKGTMSIRAQLVRSPEERRRLLRFGWRERLEKTLLLRPYQQLLDRHTDGQVPAHYFIAESPLSREQVTVDGFVQDGKAVIMGIVDSVFYPGTRSFQRFQYPSSLPAAVQERMGELVRALVERSGLDHTCFNVELFYEASSGAIHVIEVNPRMSYQFGDLYQRVDGTNTYHLQVRLALGEPAAWKPAAGSDRVAASFVMRRFSDARILAVPGPEDLRRVEECCPGTTVRLLCAGGKRLSDYEQDVESYRYCIVNLGAPDEPRLQESFSRIERLLPFRFQEAADGPSERSLPRF